MRYSGSLLTTIQKKIKRTKKKIINFERELIYHQGYYESEVAKIPIEQRPSKIYQMDFFAG